MSTSKYAFLSTPAILAGTMIADLGNGEETWNEEIGRASCRERV